LEKILTRKETIFKIIKPIKGIICVDSPKESDLLDCEHLETMTLVELSSLKSLLPLDCVARLWVSLEIKLRTYSQLASINVKSSLAILKQAHGSTVTIRNMNIGEATGQSKISH